MKLKFLVTFIILLSLYIMQVSGDGEAETEAEGEAGKAAAVTEAPVTTKESGSDGIHQTVALTLLTAFALF